MNHFFIKYLIAQLKRALRLFPAIFCVTFILCILIGVLSFALLKDSADQEKNNKYKIGIVGDAEDSFLGVGIHTLQRIDDSGYILEFQEMSEKEARNKMSTGGLLVYFVIPDHFIESVLHAEYNPITYVTTNGEASIGTAIMSELAESVTVLLQCSQTGIYAAQDYMIAHDTDDFWENTNRLNMLYIEQILNRNELFSVKTLGLSDQLSSTGYYFCGILILFLLLWGISAGSLFGQKNDSVSVLYYAKGKSMAALVLAEFLSYFALMSLTISCILLCMVRVVPDGVIERLNVAELKTLKGGELSVFWFRMLPVLLVIAALQFLLYEITNGILSGILWQFLTALALSYVSGCIYPVSFFPEKIRILSSLLPTGMARIYTGRLLTKEPAAGVFWGMMLYTILFLGAAVCVRTFRNVNRRQERT